MPVSTTGLQPEGQTQLPCSGQSRRVGWQMGGRWGGGGIRDQSCGQWTIPRRLRMAYVPRRLSVDIVQGKSRRRGLGSAARTPRAISCNEEEKEEQDKEAAFNVQQEQQQPC